MLKIVVVSLMLGLTACVNQNIKYNYAWESRPIGKCHAELHKIDGLWHLTADPGSYVLIVYPIEQPWPPMGFQSLDSFGSITALFDDPELKETKIFDIQGPFTGPNIFPPSPSISECKIYPLRTPH